MDFLKTIYSWACTGIRIVLFFLIVVPCFLYLFGSYRIVHSSVFNLTDTIVQHPQSISLPYTQSSSFSKANVPDGAEKTYLFNIDVMGYPGQRLSWQVIPKGCITAILVNQKKIKFDYSDTSLFCNSGKGFMLDLTSSMLPGHNRISLALTDFSGGHYGLSVRPFLKIGNKNIYSTPKLTLLILVWLFGALLYQMRFGLPVTIAATFAMVIYLQTYTQLGKADYSPDWWGHIPYVRYIAEHWLPPPPTSGWESYHPPLYYYFAAIAGKIAEYYDTTFLKGARSVTLIGLAGFLVYGMLFLRELIRPYWLRFLCTCTLLFWPLNMILSGRITNEVLSYTFWAAAYYYLLLWYQRNEQRYLGYALISSGIMMLVKVSALIPMGTIGAVVLLQLWREENKLRDFFTRRIILSALVLVLCIGLTFGRTYYYKLRHNPHLGLIVSNIYKDPFYDYIRSKPSWHKLTYVDLDLLRNTAYVGILGEDRGRQLFWVTYIKTASFGFYDMPNPSLAIKINLSLTFLIACAFAMIALVWRHDRVHLFLILSLLLGIGAHITNRIITMTTVTHDARLTFPIIILWIGWLGYAVQSQLERKRYLSAGLGLLALLAYTSLSFWYELKFTNLYRLISIL